MHLRDDRYDAEVQAEKDAEERSRWLLAGARRLADAVREAGPGTGVLSRRAALDGSRLEVSGSRRLLAHWLEHSRLEPA